MVFSFLFKPYIAVIGDIKDSKNLKNRMETQEKLKETLDNINQKYEQNISSKFIITLGDEFQGLLCSGERTMELINEIERNMHPVKIRFGIGIGEITTEIDRNMAIGADGPGYYKARSAINYLKQNEKRKETDTADIRVEIEGDNQASETMINTILTLLSVIKGSWSDRQREVIWDMLEHQDGQSNAADRLSVRQPTVQKTLAKGGYYAYIDALKIIDDALGEVKRDGI